MTYRIAGIDVHKRMLAVVVADVAVDGGYEFDRRTFGTAPEQLRQLAAWFLTAGVDEVVMESTAQYWRPVWDLLEQAWGRRVAASRARRRPPAHSISRRRNPIADRSAARRISRTRSGW
jgi:hypothetical protein